MQFALAVFNIPIVQFALDFQKKQFERKQIGFETKENGDGRKVCS